MQMIAKDEGLRLKPYRDSAGKLSVGYGRNLEDAGITPAEAVMLLEHDVERVEGSLQRVVPAFVTLSNNRQMVLVNMAFNLGVVGLLGFKKMLAAVDARDFETAAAEMMNSTWADQVGDRAKRLASIMRAG